jgi:hypothetical protein
MPNPNDIDHAKAESDDKVESVATCAQHAIESLCIDAPDQLFERFGRWTFEQDWKTVFPLHITDPYDFTHQLEFSWYPGGRHLTLENLVFPSPEAASAANAPSPALVVALEDNAKEIHLVSPLGPIELPLRDGWILFWALKEQEYWIVFNWDQPPQDRDFVRNPVLRFDTFYETNVSMSYCRLSGFSFDTMSGKMESIYKGGFTVRQVTRNQDGILVPLYEGVPASPHE